MKNQTINKVFRWLATIVVLYFVIHLAVYLISVKLDWDSEAPPGYPRGAQDVMVYAINPETILPLLENGETNVFIPFTENPGTYVSPWQAKSFHWNQEAYLSVANKLHEYVWKEPFGKWHLHNVFFRKYDCLDNSDGFDQARYIYYRSDNDLYTVHELWITPSEGQVGAGVGYYPYTGKWKNIDLSGTKIPGAYEAFEVAEKSGGKDAGLKTGDNCTITVELAPYVYKTSDSLLFENNYSWGWHVRYSSDNVGIFNVAVDPYTGKFQINNRP